MESIGSLIDQVINKIGEWTFDHKVYLSSKISDYDYDPEHPERTDLYDTFFDTNVVKSIAKDINQSIQKKMNIYFDV